MRYAVISTDGVLTLTDNGSHGGLDWRAVLGPEGRARVGLHPSTRTAGFVNDCGLLFPKAYPRNVVGSCLLAAFGATLQPYAGPVILTGWDWNHEPTEICDLKLSTKSLTLLADRIRRALNGEDVRDADGGPGWSDRIRETGRIVADGPTPQITVHPVRPS